MEPVRGYDITWIIGLGGAVSGMGMNYGNRTRRNTSSLLNCELVAFVGHREAHTAVNWHRNATVERQQNGLPGAREKRKLLVRIVSPLRLPPKVQNDFLNVKVGRYLIGSARVNHVNGIIADVAVQIDIAAGNTKRVLT